LRRSLKQGAEFVLVDAAAVGVLRTDHLFVQQVHDRVVQRLHAVFLSNLQHAGNLERLGFADQVGDGGRYNQYFQRSHAAFDIDAFEQVLGNNPLQRFRECVADLVLLAVREYVNHAVDGFCRARCVQRAKNEVAGGSRFDSELDRFEIAHFADEDDVGILTKRAAKGGGKRFRMHADFAMIDQTTLALMNELDGIFNG